VDVEKSHQIAIGELVLCYVPPAERISGVGLKVINS
jgi:hypothetical protein